MNKAGRGIAPYVIVLLVTLFLFYQISQLDFEAPAGRTGPDVWPRMILILATLVCVYEIARRMISGGGQAPADVGQADTADALGPSGQAEAAMPAVPTYPRLVAAGVVMSIAYVALLGTLGFFLCTTLYIAGFITLGGYRRILVTAACSVLGGLFFMFMFMKVVYVSLPLGVEPFAQVSFMLMRVMGIR